MSDEKVDLTEGLRHLNPGSIKRLNRIPGDGCFSTDTGTRDYYECYERLVNAGFNEDEAIGFLTKCYQAAHDDTAIIIDKLSEAQFKATVGAAVAVAQKEAAKK